MHITSTSLRGVAAVAALLAGVLFAGVQFVHPVDEVASVTTPMWAVTGWLTFAMACLGLIGVTGLYLRQVPQTGVLGLSGFALLALFYVLTCAFTFAETLVLPLVADSAPAFTADFLGIVNGEGTGGTLGALEAIGPLSGVLFMGGGLLFGVALFRARVLARWAAALLAVGAVVPLPASFLPHDVGRFAALPVAVALVGLGCSLWVHRRVEVRT